MKEYYTIKEISKITTLTRRMICLRIKHMQTQYPHLISGGSQGKKYVIHYSLLDKISKRKNKMNSELINLKEHLKSKERQRTLFKSIDWTYFFTINLASDIADLEEILNQIPKSFYSHLFYSIHYSPDRKKENRHIHLVIETKLGSKELKRHLRRLIKKRNVALKIDDFDKTRIDNCFYYFTTDKPSINPKPSQKVFRYDLMEGVSI